MKRALRHKWLLAAALPVLTLPPLLWLAAPAWIADPMPELAKMTPVRCYADRTGKVFKVEPTYDYEWRFPVRLDEISPAARQVMLGAEDARFYQHGGVDYPALMRAAGQNLFARRIVSGASTVTMQLASLAQPPGRRRTFAGKIEQMLMARKLERLYAKDRILAEYLNRIPFGGKIYGIEAAARYYFGTTAAELDIAQSSLLCGLPQRPNAYRPDRYPERARKRQMLVLRLLVRHRVLSEAEAERIFREVRLPFRDFRRPPAFEMPENRLLAHYAAAALDEAGRDQFRIDCAVDADLTAKVGAILARRAAQLPGVGDAAAVVLDSRTGEILVSLGTLDYGRPGDGEVDMVRARRSAGSVLKPFLYAAAIDGGLITADTVLIDAPLRIGNYAPGNYDGAFRGRVTAREALAESYNTPAVRLLARLGTGRVLELFDSLGLGFPGPGREAGLSLALGSAGYRLLDLAAACRTLTADGAYRAPTYLAGRKTSSRQVFSPGAAAMAAAMLRSRRLPGCDAEISWKTGTSNNQCDAWCFAFNPDYTVGVWFGNKSGAPSAALVGVLAAAPAAGEIFSLLGSSRAFAPWPSASAEFETAELCAESGLAPSVHCVRRRRLPVLRQVPLRRCEECGLDAAARPVIFSPAPKTYLAGSGGKVKLPVTLSPGSFQVFADGVWLGVSDSLRECEFAAGRHRFTVVAADGQSAEVIFTVSTGR
ncbi:MAG: transglycosylase domain-containing protein [Victivallaceae bacterium]